MAWEEIIRARWPELIAALRDGAGIKASCERLGFTRTALYDFRAKYPEARAEVERALEAGADSVVDDLDATICNTGDHRLARVRAEFLWRMAAARNPERYADRQRIEHKHVSLDLNAIILEAQRRIELRNARRIIDVTPAPLALADLL